MTPTKWHRDTSWSELGYWESDDLVTKAWFTVGDEGENAPNVMKVHFPAGHRVAPHLHNVAYAEIILEGSQRVGRRWYGPGDIRVVGADTAYGPLESGPDGVTVLIVFDGDDWPHVDLPKTIREQARAQT